MAPRPAGGCDGTWKPLQGGVRQGLSDFKLGLGSFYLRGKNESSLHRAALQGGFFFGFLHAGLPGKQLGADLHEGAQWSRASFPTGMLLGPRGEEGRLLLQPRGAAPALCRRVTDPQEERAGGGRRAASFGGGCCSFYTLSAGAFWGDRLLTAGL